MDQKTAPQPEKPAIQNTDLQNDLIRAERPLALKVTGSTLYPVKRAATLDYAKIAAQDFYREGCDYARLIPLTLLYGFYPQTDIADFVKRIIPHILLKLEGINAWLGEVIVFAE